MGWIFSLGLFVAAVVKHSFELLIASGLFAISGTIAVASHTIKNGMK